MLESFKKVLVLAPHADDGELGAGGTINKLVNANAEVYYVGFSTAEESVPDGLPRDILRSELRDATAVLGITEENHLVHNYPVRKLNYARQDILENMIALRTKINPDLVLMPCLHDIHQDHSTVAQEGLRAFKFSTILSYELIWNNLTFNSSAFVCLDKSHVEKKCEALMKYTSQQEKAYMSKDFIYSLARARGVQSGTEFAETFEVVRWMMT